MTVSRRLIVAVSFICFSLLFASTAGQGVTCDTNSPGDVILENFNLDCPNGWNIQSGGSITINAGNVTASSINFDAATSISITSLNATVDANVDITAVTDLIQTDVSITSSTGDLTITANAATGDNLNLAGNSISLSVDADISIQNGLLDFADSVQLDASVSLSLDALDIEADVDVDLNALDDLSLNNLSITANGDITLAGASVADIGVDLSGTNVVIRANDREISLDAGSILSDALQIDAATDINLAGISITADGVVNINATDLLSLDSDVTLNANVNDISLSANVISAVNLSLSGASVSIDALNGDISLSGSIDVSDLQLNAPANIDLSGLQISVTGDVSLDADADINLDNVNLDISGNIAINAQNLVGESLTIANAADVSLNIDGDIDLDTGSINANGILDLLSNTEISISSLDITLTGNVNISAVNLLNSTGLSITTFADISIQVPSLIGANIDLSGTDISLTVDGTVSLDSGSIDASGLLSLDATADIELRSLDLSANGDVSISTSESSLIHSSLSISSDANISLLARLISGINLSLDGVDISLQNTEVSVSSTVCLADPLSALENNWPNGSPSSGIYLSVADIAYAQLSIVASGNDCIGLFANEVVERQASSDSQVNIDVTMDSSDLNVDIAAMVWIDVSPVVHSNWNVNVESNNIGILLQTSGSIDEIVFSESLSINVEGTIALQVDTAVLFDTVDGVVNAVGDIVGALLNDVSVTGDITIDAQRSIGSVAGFGIHILGDVSVDGGNLVLDASVSAEVMSTLSLLGIQLDSLITVSNDANVEINGLVSPPVLNGISVRVNDIEVLDTSSLSINSLITDATSILSQDNRVSLTGDLYQAAVDASLEINAATDKITALIIADVVDFVNVDISLVVERLDDIRVLDTLDSVTGVVGLSGSTLDISVSARASSSSIGEVCVLTSNIELNVVDTDINIDIDARVHAVTNVIESVLNLVDSNIDISVRASSEITNGLNNLDLTIENSNISVAITCSQGTCVAINFNEISVEGDADVSISGSVTGICPLGSCSGILGNAGATITNNLDATVTLTLLGTSSEANVCPNCVGVELPDVDVSLSGSLIVNGEGTTGVLLGSSTIDVDVAVIDGNSNLAGVSFAEFGFGLDIGTATFLGSLVQVSGFSQTQADLFMDSVLFDFSNANSEDCGAIFQLNGDEETQNIDINVNPGSIFNSCGVIFSGFSSVEAGLSIDADVTFVNGINSNGGVSTSGTLNISGELCGLFESNSIFVSKATISTCESRTRSTPGLDIVSDVLSVADLNGSNSVLPLNVRTRILNIGGVQIGLEKPIPSATIAADLLQLEANVDVSARSEEASVISVEGDLNLSSNEDAAVALDANTNLVLSTSDGLINLGALNGPLASVQLHGNSVLSGDVNLRQLSLGQGLFNIDAQVNAGVNLTSTGTTLSGTTKTTLPSIRDISVDATADVSTRVLNELTTILPTPVVVDMESDTGLLHIGQLSLNSALRVAVDLLSSDEYSRLFVENIISLSEDGYIEVDVEISNGNEGETFFVLSSNTDLTNIGLRSITGDLLEEFSVIEGSDGEEYVVSFQIQPEISARRAGSYMSLHKNTKPFAVEDSCYVHCDLARVCSCCVNLLHNDFDDDPLDEITAQMTAMPPGWESRFVLNTDGNLCYTRPAEEGNVVGDEYFSASYRVIDSPGDRSDPAPINFRMQTSDPSEPSGPETSSPSPSRAPSNTRTPPAASPSAQGVSVSRAPVPSASRAPVPSASRAPVPSASRAPVPSASRSPIPVNEDDDDFVEPSRTPAPIPSASRSPIPVDEDDDDFALPSPTRTPFVINNDDDDDDDDSTSATTFSYFTPADFSSQFNDDDDESFSSASQILPLTVLFMIVVALF